MKAKEMIDEFQNIYNTISERATNEKKCLFYTQNAQQQNPS